jgi:hypothetical protein
MVGFNGKKANFPLGTSTSSMTSVQGIGQMQQNNPLLSAHPNVVLAVFMDGHTAEVNKTTAGPVVKRLPRATMPFGRTNTRGKTDRWGGMGRQPCSAAGSGVCGRSTVQTLQEILDTLKRCRVSFRVACSLTHCLNHRLTFCRVLSSVEDTI